MSSTASAAVCLDLCHNAFRSRAPPFLNAAASRSSLALSQAMRISTFGAIAGPIDLLHFCGEHHGKQAVIDAIVRQVPTLLEVTNELRGNSDRWRTCGDFMRLSAIHAATGRAVSYRCAQFLRFSDGELVEFRALIDSFDAAEQVLGHRSTRRWMRRWKSRRAAIASRFEAALDAWLQRRVRPIPRVFRRQSARPTASGVGVSGTVEHVGRLVDRGLGLRSPRNRPVASAVPLHGLGDGRVPKGNSWDLP